MAWNEPGGGNRDPWGGGNRGGGGGDNQGPPDLDEAINKVRDKVTQLFGGKKGGGAGNGGGSGQGFKGPGAKGIALLGGLVIAGWLASGIYIVDEGQRGVELTFGANTGVTQPGPHWHFPRPIGSVERVDVSEVRTIEIGYESMGERTRSVLREALMLTRDENIVNLKVAVQYRVSDPANYLFNFRFPDDTLKQLAESALREVVGKAEAPEDVEIGPGEDFGQLADELADQLTEEELQALMTGADETARAHITPLEWVLTQGRAQVADESERLIQEALDRYQAGITLVRVAIQDAQPPEEVQPAFADAIRAREDQQRTISRARAYANALLPRAEGQAARQREEAQAYRDQVIARAQGESERFTALLNEYERAPQVTRQRLYLETMERVLGNSSKIMIDVEGGQPLMYLPLDRMIDRRGVEQDGEDNDEARDLSMAPPLGGRDAVTPTERARDSLRTREVR
ncbi:FtsH protease activity modulator HflK [Alkalilimnicola ehrlichii MLHE-1]|uniref:Protein HflK n=1 Tax=Alkalilimnicola ehrlichii (strain ATCC BAA-1101 / DSM 17681 / MLHE-1) TaxID=187272 RepID=Q0AB58_ALKEH|nr:FtsH protease activity modulator HflK [Alkalilimnicola ehrlichii]ABI55929.1 protease FtsH subunit HflK [Alkalilimnicola ehrlichii MLHE-1]